MSNDSYIELIATVSREIAEFQSAADLVDEAVSGRLGINRTDQRCLSLLYGHGPMSAGQLAAASGLSPAATTTALDRLEEAGYARRMRDPNDRRGVLVEATEQTQRLINEMYGPIAQAGQSRLAEYSERELLLLRDFLHKGRALQIEQAARIRALGAPLTAQDAANG